MIKIVTGPVKAGKSKRLIETYERLIKLGKKVQVFSSKLSLTSGENIVSRYGTNIKAIPISNMFDIKHHVKNDTDIVMIDEFQFLDMNSKELKLFMDNHYYDHDYILFGLNLDYQKRPFKLMAHALCYADIIEIVSGYCDICGCEPSKYSLRLENGKPANIKDDGKIVLLDGEYGDIDIEYQSVGEKCWKEIYNNGK